MQCPHCLSHFHESWTHQAITVGEDRLGWAVSYTVCPACKRTVLELGRARLTGRSHGAIVAGSTVPVRLIYPKTISRSPIPAEVPKEFVTDYLEACLVVADSEKASAALSRRCLQYLLREKAGIKKDDLAKEIQQVLDSKQLPTHLADDLDAIRNIGNFAAHPLKATNTGEIVDVEPQEAEWLLTVLEGLFDFYFVQPARAKARREGLNIKLQTLGKPPMKTG